jgi:hypothetical protein
MVKAAKRKTKKSKRDTNKPKRKKALSRKTASPKRKKLLRQKGPRSTGDLEPAAFAPPPPPPVDCSLPRPGTPLQQRIIASVLESLKKFSNEVYLRRPYPPPANNAHNLGYVVDSFRRDFADVIDMDRFSLDGKEIINETQNKNVSCIIKLFLDRSKAAILTGAGV